MLKEERRANLVKALKYPTSEMKARLEFLKAEGIEGQKRPDFIWHYLLQSFSTMGNSNGHKGLILNKKNYEQVRFEQISTIEPSKRKDYIQSILEIAEVNEPDTKAKWLSNDYNIVSRLGGLTKAKDKAFSQVGTEAKILFMKQFQGIGDKYGRNIWMDVYHSDFWDSIAIDRRINYITETMGYSFSEYKEHEKFYLDIAHEVELQGWEVDRLLYNYKNYFLNNLNN